MADFSFRIMSYNLHSGIGMDGRVDYDRLSDVIAGAGADLAALQEVAIDHPKSPGADPLRIMGEKLGRKWIFGKVFSAGVPGRLYDYGLGVLSRWNMAMEEVLPLPCPAGVEPRIALIVRIEAPVPFYFICTHLSYGMTPEFDGIRLEQIAAIRKRVKDKGYLPAVLAGDFNATPETSCLQSLKEEWTAADGNEPTYPSAAPSLKIDYIAFTPQNAFSCRSFRVVEETLASDHRPVAAELTLKRTQ